MRIPLLSERSVAQITAAQAHARQVLGQRLPAHIEPSHVTVIGGAASGLAIALILADAGVAVTYLEEDDSSLERAEFYLSRMVQTAGRTVPNLLDFSISGSAASRSDVILDLSLESLTAKTVRLQQVMAGAPDTALVVVNLAGQELEQIASQLSCPSRVVGAQLCHAMGPSGVAELAAHPKSSKAALEQLWGFAGLLGRLPVNAGRARFLSERFQMRVLEAADTLLMDGSTPWEIDEALEQFGYQMGVYEAQDLIGMDVAYALRQRMPAEPGRRKIPIADRAVEEGRLGKKASVGWYRYPGGEGKVIDPLVEDLCREEAHFARVQTRSFADDDLRLRILLALINEAAWALGEGVPVTDIDLISLSALGFPQDMGGVIWFADDLGAGAIVDALTGLCAEDPIAWRIAPALRRAASDGVPLSNTAISF
jgi:3-hydroxyacyl-CoA dehydrogenase